MGIGTAALIAGGISAASQAGNAIYSGKMNKKTRQFAENMYYRQRADALQDWQKTVDYNDPTAQMARFKAAGLNENLIYGQSHTADAVRSSSPQSWNPETPQFDGNAVLKAYTDTRMSMAQQDQMLKQQQLLDQEIELKRAQTIFQNVQSETGTFDLNLKKLLKDRNVQLMDYTLQGKEKDLSRQDQDYNFNRLNQSMKLQQNDLDAAIKAQSIDKGIEEIASIKTSRAKTEDERKLIQEAVINAKKDGRIKELDAQLADKKIRPGDPLWLRSLYIILNKYFPHSE